MQVGCSAEGHSDCGAARRSAGGAAAMGGSCRLAASLQQRQRYMRTIPGTVCDSEVLY